MNYSTTMVPGVYPWNQAAPGWEWYSQPVTYAITGGYHAEKCPNCGYCRCCGKADIPGSAVREEDDAPQAD